MKNQFRVVASVILILIMVFVGTLVDAGDDRRSDTDVLKVLLEIASELNANLPMMVDKNTRLDTTMGGPGRKFTYYHTFPRYASTDVDLEKLKAELPSMAHRNVCGLTDMEPMFDAGVTVTYVWRDNNGVELTRASITPEACGYAQ